MDPCFSSWADWMEQAWAGDRPQRILDLCCGTGLMTAELLNRGYDVVGVDASPAMLERARHRLADRAHLVEAWLPDLPVAGKFDAAVSTFDGLNYLTLPELRATFAAVIRVLRPGGWLIFDVHGQGAEPFLRTHPVIQGSAQGASFTLTSTVVDRTCTTTIDFTDASTSFTEAHTQHLHDPAEITGALQESGFRVMTVVDEYSDDEATTDTLRATWVARREDS